MVGYKQEQTIKQLINERHQDKQLISQLTREGEQHKQLIGQLMGRMAQLEQSMKTPKDDAPQVSGESGTTTSIKTTFF